MYSLVFAFAPDVDARRRRILSPGGLVGVAIWIVASGAFFFYVSNFGNYGATYGAFAGAVILLLWLYLTSNAFLLGGELNGAIERAQIAGRAGPPPPSPPPSREHPAPPPVAPPAAHDAAAGER